MASSARGSEVDELDFPKPGVTVDVVVLTIVDGEMGVLLHRRPGPPFAGEWALPGGFIRLEETLEDAAKRILHDKASLEDVWLEQLYTFGGLDRDPRSRVLSVAHLALVDIERFRVRVPETPEITTALVTPASGPPEALLVDGELVELAFDHLDIVRVAIERLRGKLDWTPVGYQLLPDEFTIRDLRRVHEAVLGRPITATNFHRRMVASGEIEPTGRLEADVGHRPAELYRFVR